MVGAKPGIRAEWNPVNTTRLYACSGLGLVFKAHGRLYHSTLGLRVIKKKKKSCMRAAWNPVNTTLL